jgi:bacteriocin biosynthesis cyclodehydratase domain-containing protein
VRPAIRAGLLPLWRDRDTIQIGVDPRRAVALTGVGAAAALIGVLDGSRDRTQVLAAAAELGVPAPVTERMLALLAAAGMLIDFPARLVQATPLELRTLLLPELAATSLTRMDSDGGCQVLVRRRAATVHICGTGRIPAAIAEVLTSSGVAAAVKPLPILTDKPGRRARTAPPELAVLTGRQSPDSVIYLLREQVPHLAVSAGEAIGIVGPLVRPGVTACLRCLDLARAERDQAWPLILAQLGGRQPDPEACDAVLTMAVAAQAAAQALHFIDLPGAKGPAENATLELVQPGWQWRRRTWPPHPACICRASAAA